MTVGQRIAQKRKELGLSQETLGEQLGVSRQAIYKWESNAALPEIEKLVALSRIFAVPVGWLLGVEESVPEEPKPEHGPQGGGELTHAQLNMVEEIVRRYQESQPVLPKRRRWPWVLAAVILIVVFARLFSNLHELQTNYNRLENSITYIDWNVDSQISSITSRVADILERMNSFTVEHSAKIVSADLAANTVTFDLHAVPKTYTEGMTALFRAEYGDGFAQETAVCSRQQDFTAQLTCPLTDEIEISVVFITGDKQETQTVKTFSGLYTGSFPVQDISASGPLCFDLEGDTLIRDYYAVRLYSSYTNDDLPAAALAQIRLGWFEDNKLVYWLEQVDKQPDSFVGDWGDHLFFRSPKNYTLDRSKRYSLAAVVEDEYGREIVCSEIPIVYEPGGTEDDGDWTYPSDGRTSHDPEDWEY